MNIIWCIIAYYTVLAISNWLHQGDIDLLLALRFRHSESEQLQHDVRSFLRNALDRYYKFITGETISLKTSFFNILRSQLNARNRLSRSWTVILFEMEVRSRSTKSNSGKTVNFGSIPEDDLPPEEKEGTDENPNQSTGYYRSIKVQFAQDMKLILICWFGFFFIEKELVSWKILARTGSSIEIQALKKRALFFCKFIM